MSGVGPSNLHYPNPRYPNIILNSEILKDNSISAKSTNKWNTYVSTSFRLLSLLYHSTVGRKDILADAILLAPTQLINCYAKH